MKKRLSLFVILILFSISFCKAQVGDVCTNPFIASLCDSNTFSAVVPDFKNDVSKWIYNLDTIYAYGEDIFYKIKLPASAYQPVNLNAAFSGYFPVCSGSCYQTVYFLWFTNSPCSSNPVAVNKVIVSGTPSFQDSVLVNYPISNAQSTYYLVIDFATYTGYQYNLKLGFSNNQPYSQPICSAASPPYKGELEPDSSSCYSSNNPYHLPLSFLNDNPQDSNTLIPSSLNQDLNYLPINDDNGNGFALTIKTTELQYVNSNGDDTAVEIYQSFDQFPYTYNAGNQNNYNLVSYNYDIAFTLFMKNSTGISGLKGFRIQVPYGIGNSVGLPTGKGAYDTSGMWNMNYDGGTSTYTWLFNGKGGRGDDTGFNSYSCRVYTFAAHFNYIDEGINAWYLPDNFGNDSIECVPNPNPPRTDCPIVPTNYEQDWIPLFAAGNGGSGGGGITGQPCGTEVEEDLGPLLYDCDFINQIDFTGYTAVTIDDYGCANEVDYHYDIEDPDFTFNDQLIIYSGQEEDAYVCPEEHYNLVLNGNGDYIYSPGITPSTLVYLDSNYVYHPVDSLGNIHWNQDYYSLVLPDSLPPYPASFSMDSFMVPLSYPGVYTIIYTVYDSSTNSFLPSCLAGDLVLHLSYIYDANFTWTVTGRDVLFQPVIDSFAGTIYSWDFGDGGSSHDRSPVHLYSGTDTSYYVCLTLNDNSGTNCAGTFCMTVNIGTSSVPAIANQTGNIQVYPNPFDNYLLIKAKDKSIKSVELYDVLGRKILSEEWGENYPDNNVLRLNVSAVQDGMYYVKIKTAGADYIQNVVKCR